jgi:hypothetical protein
LETPDFANPYALRLNLNRFYPSEVDMLTANMRSISPAYVFGENTPFLKMNTKSGLRLGTMPDDYC